MPHIPVPFLVGHWMWRWTVVLPAVQRDVAVMSARPCRRRGCPQHRAPAGCRCPPAASAVHASGPSMSAGGADLARNPGVSAEPDTAAVSTMRPGLRPGAGRTADIRRGHGRRPPEQGGRFGGRWQPTVHARPAGYGSGHKRRTRRPRRQRNLDAGGCPDEGVRRTACCRSLPDTAAVSAVLPELRPPGDAVRTAGVHRGHRRRLRVSAATGSGRRTGGR
jgi:hypothetical protein